MASPWEDNFPIMDIKSLHHVAYRCKDAKQTAEFYTKVLGLEYAMAMAEDRVPSTGEQSPWVLKSRQARDNIAHAVENERQALARLPYTKAQLQTALDSLAASPNGEARHTRRFLWGQRW